MAEESDSYPLHEAVFNNDLKSLSRLLRKHDVAAKDRHGELRHNRQITFFVQFNLQQPFNKIK
jgi:hypothetical protein